MPWRTRSDVSRHNKAAAKSPEKAKAWREVANKLLKGGSSEASAIRQANAVSARIGHTKKKSPGLWKTPMAGSDHRGSKTPAHEERGSRRNAKRIGSDLSRPPTKRERVQRGKDEGSSKARHVSSPTSRSQNNPGAGPTGLQIARSAMSRNLREGPPTAIGTGGAQRAGMAQRLFGGRDRR
jgi:hypothetical protein